MLSNLGNLLLFLSAILSITIIYFCFRSIKFPQEDTFKKIIQISLIQTTIIISCFFSLVAAFIYSDFSLANVYENSHTAKPLLYKISGSWGNHEGSLMLWVIILSLFSFLFLISNKKHPKNFKSYTLIFQNRVKI